MSLFDSVLNAVSDVAKLFPGVGTAISSAIDVVKNLWSMAQPVVSDVARSAAEQYTSDWPQEQQDWVNNAIDVAFG